MTSIVWMRKLRYRGAKSPVVTSGFKPRQSSSRFHPLQRRAVLKPSPRQPRLLKNVFKCRRFCVVRLILTTWHGYPVGGGETEAGLSAWDTGLWLQAHAHGKHRPLPAAQQGREAASVSPRRGCGWLSVL